MDILALWMPAPASKNLSAQTAEVHINLLPNSPNGKSLQANSQQNFNAVIRDQTLSSVLNLFTS